MKTLPDTATRIELRCPSGPRKLLGAVLADHDKMKIVDGNLMELACRDCRANVEAISGKKPTRVLHYFNVIGELVNSEVVWN